jgi:hypothetical protein
LILNFLNLFISEIRFNGLVGVALRPPPVADKGSKALSEIMSKRQHIYVQRIATIFQTGEQGSPLQNNTPLSSHQNICV